MSKNNLKVYYSHPFESEIHGAAKLILGMLENALPNWQFINPFDSPLTEVWLKDPKNITTAKRIMEKDLKLICQSDIVVAYFPDIRNAGRGVIGTPIEIFYAAYNKGTPVFCLTEFNHPWLMALDVFCADNIEKLIEKLKEIEQN